MSDPAAANTIPGETVEELRHELELTHRKLAEAHKIDPSPETANNLGVAMSRLGAGIVARRLFAQALKGYAGYVDAARNLMAQEPAAVTPHPLRQAAVRAERLAPVRRTA